ncbi:MULTISPECIES: hypothetical protein [Sphingobacterium]|uniref:hypothetical protein n=1 Tax=Sphingobacterium TaxID=28453 RepID=UPI00257BF3EE|nr:MULTISPECIES: hypothetical protein [Sphingobacterium]
MIGYILKPELFSFLSEVDTIVSLLTVFGLPLYLTLKKSFKERKQKIRSVKEFPKVLKVTWALSAVCLFAAGILGAGIWNLKIYIDVNLYLLFALALSVPTAVFIPMYYSAIGDLKKYILKNRNY